MQGGDALFQALHLATQKTQLCQRDLELEAHRREVDEALVEGDGLGCGGPHLLSPLGAPISLHGDCGGTSSGEAPPALRIPGHRPVQQACC